MKNITKSSKKSNKTQKSKVFQPLIASSLALALGVSVSVGQTPSKQERNINSAGSHTIASGNYNGNILPPQDSATDTNVTIGTTGQVTFVGNIGGQVNGNNTVADINVDFNLGSTMQGNIQTGISGNGNDFSSNNVTFNGGTGNVLTGNILSYGTGDWHGMDSANGNHVVFASGSMNGNISTFTSTPSGYEVKYSRYGYNEVSFTASANQSINGNITTTGGNNIISFSGSGEKTITGNLEASMVGHTSYGRSNNKISNTATKLILGNGSSIIKGSIGGNNLITTTDLTLNMTSIIAETGSGTDQATKNLFKISGDTHFSHSLVIKADSSITTGSNVEKYNIFQFGGNVTFDNNVVITELSARAYNNWGSTNTDRVRNILSFDNLANRTTLTIGDINKKTTVEGQGTGNNYIGKNLVSGNASDSSLNLVSNFNSGNTPWHSDNFRAENLDLVITGKVYAYRNGRNYFNTGSISITGEIDGDAGYNHIATSGNFSSGAIKARWGGSNTFYIGGNTSISGNIIAEGSDGDASSNGSNTITFYGQSNTFSMSSGTKIIAGGTQNNTLNFSGNYKC